MKCPGPNPVRIEGVMGSFSRRLQRGCGGGAYEFFHAWAAEERRDLKRVQLFDRDVDSSQGCAAHRTIVADTSSHVRLHFRQEKGTPSVVTERAATFGSVSARAVLALRVPSRRDVAVRRARRAVLPLKRGFPTRTLSGATEAPVHAQVPDTSH